MPRLTKNEYLQYYLGLRLEWLRGARAFVMLTPTEQVAIHNFYEPSLELSPRELARLRRRVTKADPSLPQRAGKAWVRIEPVLDSPIPRYAGDVSIRPGRRKGWVNIMAITSLVQPQIDPAKIARILVEAAMDEARKERMGRTPLPDLEDLVDEDDRAA